MGTMELMGGGAPPPSVAQVRRDETDNRSSNSNSKSKSNDSGALAFGMPTM